MASWDSADLLAMFNSYAGRPTTDAVTAALKYARLSKAQDRVIAKVSAIAPRSLYPKVAYGSLPTLTTSDNQVFTFGTDGNGYAKFPMGRGGIYGALADIPDRPWTEGRDFISEGTQIRIPNNGTYTGTLYWYGIAQPADINGTDQPALFPEGSRDLIVIEAVRRFAQEGTRNVVLMDEMDREWSKAWPVWCLVWKTQFRDGGALNVFSGRDLAIVGQSSQWGA